MGKSDRGLIQKSFTFLYIVHFYLLSFLECSAFLEKLIQSVSGLSVHLNSEICLSSHSITILKT